MARPAKAIKASSGVRTKENRAFREQTEDRLRGNAVRLNPPKHLNDGQKKIFRTIVKELKASEILSSLDIYILTACAIAVERLAVIEGMVNEDATLLCDSALMSTKDKYTKDLYRCCNELCLSPQARAKIGSLALSAARGKKKNAVLEAIEDDDE